MKRKRWPELVLLMFLASAANAALVVDQQQPTIGLEITNWIEFAQTVRAGLTGPLAQIQLAVACRSGGISVDVVELDGDVPGTRVLAHAEATAAEIPPVSPLDFRALDLNRLVHMSAGDRFALIVRNDGDCTLGTGYSSFENLYADGHLYFRYFDLWLRTFSPWDPDDLAFKTLIKTAPPSNASLCIITGFGGTLTLDAFTPACRCLRDASLRETRCGLFHPSFFLYRQLPDVIRAGQPFTVKWTLIPLTAMKDAIEVSDAFPEGFEGLKGPLVFFPGQPGQSVTLTYKAVAGPKAGSFRIDSKVLDGELRTTLEVR